MNRPVHFELPCEDPERAAKFYAEVLGWKTQKWDGPAEYWLVTTGENGTVGIDGGLLKRNDPGEHTVNTVDVVSLDETVAKATAAGGSVAVPRMPIPGMGWLAYCKDTEGNLFGLMESDPAAA